MKEECCLIEEAKELVEGSVQSDFAGSGESLFDIIDSLTSRFLVMLNEVVLCRYKYLSLWQYCTVVIDSDLLVASFVASYALKHSSYVPKLDWKRVLDHDNESLNKILYQGMVDNHYHLGGSLHVFNFTWTSIMQNKCLRRNLSYQLNFDDKLLEKAANIRGYFIQVLLNSGIKLKAQNDGCELGPSKTIEERRILFNVIREIKNNNYPFCSLTRLLFEYIVIKEKYRSLLVKKDSSGGAAFFSIIGNRSKVLTVFKNTDGIIKSLIDESIQSNILNKMEVRIKLKKPKELYKIISGINEYVKSLSSTTEVKYIITFSKRRAKKRCTIYRNQSKQEELRNDINELIEFMKEFPTVAREVVGIDVSSKEENYAPEVFTEVMRYFKANNKISLKRIYHVGEAFSDLLTGIRRIDECLLFFDLQLNDRLAHAIPVYENVRQWYDLRNNRIRLSKEEYLDNIVWLANNLKTGIPAIEAEMLLDEFSRTFSDIYKDAFLDVYHNTSGYSSKPNYEFTDISIAHYYEAWKLRNKQPEMINKYNKAGKNNIDDEIANCIAYLYFYHKDVFFKGQEIIEISISQEVLQLIETAQTVVQKRIGKKGICIEVCPSSNFSLNVISNKQTHPIINLYERYTSDPIIKDICFSINTDDMDIFLTSLPNEYSLLANAYEMKVLHDYGSTKNINDFYRWIDHIRQNSIRMFQT